MNSIITRKDLSQKQMHLLDEAKSLIRDGFASHRRALVESRDGSAMDISFTDSFRAAARKFTKLAEISDNHSPTRAEINGHPTTQSQAWRAASRLRKLVEKYESPHREARPLYDYQGHLEGRHA